MPPEVNGQRFPVEGQQFGVLARNGDPRGAACPHFSSDGSRIVYSSTMGGNQDGRLEQGATDLYVVPFGGGKGGDATAVKGASDPAFEEYYPAFSPDDTFIAYNRVPAGQRMYANPSAELYVVHERTGVSQRLRANDPPACSGRRSPGINNHWPKWSPQVQRSPSGTYYWIIFSSNRADIPPVKPSTGGGQVSVSQLYITAVVERGERGYETYPAIYLWNQPTTTLNTTPVWEVLEIPRVIQ
jgi:hypothetical protein